MGSRSRGGDVVCSDASHISTSRNGARTNSAPTIFCVVRISSVGSCYSHLPFLRLQIVLHLLICRFCYARVVKLYMLHFKDFLIGYF